MDTDFVVLWKVGRTTAQVAQAYGQIVRPLFLEMLRFKMQDIKRLSSGCMGLIYGHWMHGSR